MEEEERHLSTVEIWTEKHGRFARSHDRGVLGNSKAINSLEASPRFGPCLEAQAPSTVNRRKPSQGGSTAQKSHLSSIIIRTKHLYQGTCPFLATLSCPFPVPPNASREPDSPISMK